MGILSFLKFIAVMLVEFFRRLALLFLRLAYLFRYPLFIAALVLLLFSFAYALVAQPYQVAPKYSVYDGDWDGTSALYAYVSGSYQAKAVFASIDDFTALGSDSTLIVIAPERPFTAKEKISLRGFVSGGGTLILTGARGAAADLSEEFNVRFSNATLVDYLAFNRRQDFPVLPFAVGGDSGMEFMKFPTAIMIHPAAATIISASSPESYIDLNFNGAVDPQDAKGPFAVAIAEDYGKGKVVVISDSDVFTNDLLPRGDNLKFAAAIFSAYSHGIIAFDESHRLGEKDDLLILLYAYREQMRDASFMLLVACVAAGLMLVAHRLLTQSEEKRVEAQADLKVHPYRDMVWDIVANARLRAEPYTWLVLMQYDRFRDRLLASIDPFRREIDNDALAKKAARKHGLDESALRAALARCEKVRAGELAVTSFEEANDLCTLMDEYISKLKR